MRDEADHRPIAQAGLTSAQQAAVSMLRQIVGQSSGCGAQVDGPAWERACPDMIRVAGIFRDLWGGAGASRRRPLQMNSPESWALTKDEHRLLKAIAAAQADMLLLDNFLYKIWTCPGKVESEPVYATSLRPLASNWIGLRYPKAECLLRGL